MSLIYHTKGIVLSSREFREVDRWYKVYTQDSGKIEFLARGGSKPLAKLTPHLEMAAESDFMLVQGRHYKILVGVERKNSFQNIYDNLFKMTLAKNALHLVDIGTCVDEDDSAVYELLKNWLNFINETNEFSRGRASFLLGSFAWNLMSITGYLPELHRCLSCRRTIQAGLYKWHCLRGGVVCETCIDKNTEHWFASRQISDHTIKLIRFALEESFINQLNPHISGQLLDDFHEVTESFIVSHFPTIPVNSIRSSCSLI